MRYDEVACQIREKRKEIASSEEIIRNLQANVNEQMNRLSKADRDKSNHIRDEEKRAREQFEYDICAPFEKKIKQLEDTKIKAKLKRDKALEGITESRYKSKFKTKIDVDRELEKCKQIEEVTSKFYGKEFTKIVEDIVIDNQMVDYDVERILPNLQKATDALSGKGVSMNDLIDSMLENFEYDESKGNQQLMMACGGGILILGLLIFAYPIGVAVLIGTLIFSCLKSYLFISCTSARKGLELNVSSVDSLVKDKVKALVDRDRAKVEKNYSDAIAKITERIDKLDDDCVIELESRRGDFIFNSNRIEEDYSNLIKSIESDISVIKQNLNTEEEKLKDRKTRLSELLTEQEICLRNITNDYLPKKLRVDLSLPKDYLVDIKDNKPILFPFVREACLLVYDNDKYAQDFRSMMFFQTLARTSPDLFSFIILDQKYLGGTTISLFHEDQLAKIATTQSDMQALLENCNEEVKRRHQIVTPHGGIEKYNEFMVGQECPQETTNIIFYCYPELSDILNPVNTQIIYNGANTGYYEYIFLPSKVFDEWDVKGLRDILGMVNKIYYIGDSKISKHAKFKYELKLDERGQ